MTAQVLYCGDTSLESAASYLAGVLAYWEIDFEYRPSDVSVDEDDVVNRSLIILSDFPSSGMNHETQIEMLREVQNGTGLLMIGGWESYHGVGGDWDASPVAQALPVDIHTEDDRMNCDHPVVLRESHGHAITSGLPFANRPPVIGGFNRIHAKPDATVLLEADRLHCGYNNGQWNVQLLESHPMLVIGEYGLGKTAALATDAAPHWVGGFVDWGTGRIQAQAPNAEPIEVGDLYAKFWKQLVTFLMSE